MVKEVKNNLYRITIYGVCENTFIESETKTELFKYIVNKESNGAIISSVNLIQPNGKTPRIAFRSDKEYKSIAKERKNRITVKLQANADNYRDLVEFEIPYKWLEEKLLNLYPQEYKNIEDIDMEWFIKQCEYSEADRIFELATTDNVVISFKEIYLAEEHEDK